MEWLKKLLAVIFGLAPVLNIVAKQVFPDDAAKIDAGSKVLNAVGGVVQAMEETYPQEGVGAAKKAIAMGKLAEVAVTAAADFSTGGQKEFLTKILPIASDTIEGVITATNQALTAPPSQSDPLAGNLQ
jgi:hypothetical protein